MSRLSLVFLCLVAVFILSSLAEPQPEWAVKQTDNQGKNVGVLKDEGMMSGRKSKKKKMSSRTLKKSQNRKPVNDKKSEREKMSSRTLKKSQKEKPANDKKKKSKKN